MATFFKSLVGRFKGAPAPQLFLAAFGKHPGWNDHVDDMGLETDRLIAVKRQLYVQGIGANIDSGAWDNLEPEQRLEGFHHAFIWYSPSELTLGRFWSSRDGKGRDKYPMVTAAQCAGLPLPWAASNIFPSLEKIEERCIAVTTADAVIAAVDSARAGLRQLLPPPGSPALANDPLNPADIAALADTPAFAPAHEGFFRILYQISRVMSAYAGGKPGRPEHLRIPICSPSTPLACGVLWLRFLLSQLDPSAPVLVLMPLEQTFIDIVIGEPTAAQLFCVRAAPAKSPFTSDIPYTLGEDFLNHARKFLEACRAAPKEGPMPEIPRE